jgi:hypothetical protein
VYTNLLNGFMAQLADAEMAEVSPAPPPPPLRTSERSNQQSHTRLRRETPWCGSALTSAALAITLSGGGAVPRARRVRGAQRRGAQEPEHAAEISGEILPRPVFPFRRVRVQRDQGRGLGYRVRIQVHSTVNSDILLLNYSGFLF